MVKNFFCEQFYVTYKILRKFLVSQLRPFFVLFSSPKLWLSPLTSTEYIFTNKKTFCHTNGKKLSHESAIETKPWWQRWGLKIAFSLCIYPLPPSSSISTTQHVHNCTSAYPKKWYFKNNQKLGTLCLQSNKADYDETLDHVHLEAIRQTNKVLKTFENRFKRTVFGWLIIQLFRFVCPAFDNEVVLAVLNMTNFCFLVLLFQFSIWL